jgi:hypothetical protein
LTHVGEEAGQSEFWMHCTQVPEEHHCCPAGQRESWTPLFGAPCKQIPPEHVPAMWQGVRGQEIAGYEQVPPEHVPEEVWQASGGVMQEIAGYEQVPPEHVPGEVWQASGGVVQVPDTQVPPLATQAPPPS